MKKDKEALQSDSDAVGNKDGCLAQELTGLSREVKIEGHVDDEQASTDNVEGFVDEIALLTESECNKLQHSI